MRIKRRSASTNPNVVVKTIERMQSFAQRFRQRFWQELLHSNMHDYRNSPAAFAVEVLGSNWWSAQKEIANSLNRHRRVAVKSANGVGKTYLAADLALWFLYSYPNSIVLTSAPTWRQVRHILWQSIRQKHAKAILKLYGKPISAMLKLQDGWYAMGLSAADGVRFQGFHAANMLIILDEASGIQEDIWEAIEGIAVGENNKILAIGNPLVTNGRFYRLFQESSLWRKHTISALEHPNIKTKRNHIPGCVTINAVADLVEQWCEPITIPPSPVEEGPRMRAAVPPSPVGEGSRMRAAVPPSPAGEGPRMRAAVPPSPLGEGSRMRAAVPPSPVGEGPRMRAAVPPSPVGEGPRMRVAVPPSPVGEGPRMRAAVPPSPVGERPRVRAGPQNDSRHEGTSQGAAVFSPPPSTLSSQTTPDNFVFRGQLYRPNNLFKARVLGQFPGAGSDTLIPLAWIEAATLRTLIPEGVKKLAVDVARYGSDYTVVGVCSGPVLTHLEAHNGLDNMEVAGIINRLAYDQQPESIMIDCAGLGSGVVDRLFEMRLAGICPVNSSTPAIESHRFINTRAELYWNLRERFRLGDISIPANDSLIKQLASIRYRIASNGKIQMESKDDMKRRGESSPDHADMLAMLFDFRFKPFVITEDLRAQLEQPGEFARSRAEMDRFWPV